MKLWTVQPIHIYELINEKGFYTCNETISSFNDINIFNNAYEWIVKKMDKNGIEHPKGLVFPVWAWLQKPDLRLSGYGERGLDFCRMELEIPKTAVLLSDFDLWSFVLNDLYIGETDSDYDKYETFSDEEKERIKLESWDKIFNVTKENDWVQATFWKLSKDQIIDVRFFKCK